MRQYAITGVAGSHRPPAARRPRRGRRTGRAGRWRPPADASRPAAGGACRGDRDAAGEADGTSFDAVADEVPGVGDVLVPDHEADAEVGEEPDAEATFVVGDHEAGIPPRRAGRGRCRPRRDGGRCRRSASRRSPGQRTCRGHGLPPVQHRTAHRRVAEQRLGHAPAASPAPAQLAGVQLEHLDPAVGAAAGWSPGCARRRPPRRGPAPGCCCRRPTAHATGRWRRRRWGSSPGRRRSRAAVRAPTRLWSWTTLILPPGAGLSV